MVATRVSSVMYASVLAGLLGLPATSVTRAELVVLDDFEGTELDPAWSVTQELVTDWTYELISGELVVSDIQIDGLHGGWSSVILSQEFDPLSDFVVNATLAWDSHELGSAMQNLMVVLRGTDGEDAVWASYHDAWDANFGRISARVGDETYAGPNTLPHSGAGDFQFTRVADSVSIVWRGEEILSGIVDDPFGRLELWFMCGAWPTATFGDLSVDFISCEGDAVTPIQSTTWGMIKSIW